MNINIFNCVFYPKNKHFSEDLKDLKEHKDLNTCDTIIWDHKGIICYTYLVTHSWQFKIQKLAISYSHKVDG